MKRCIRKGLAVLVMVAMLMTMLPTGILLASAENTADFDLPEGYTLSAIETVDDLKAVHTGKEASKVYYYLTGNISIDEAEWKPLGTNENTDAFWDILDGNGYAIRFSGADGQGVKATGTWNASLLFAMNGDALVKNLTVEGSITSSAQSTGAIVGQMVNGTIDRCVNRASVTATNKEGVGGLAGRVKHGVIVNCMNYGTITGGGFTGGLVGKVSYSEKGVNAVSIANSANFGAVNGKDKVGGIVGLATADLTYTIENCYNAGTVSGSTLLTQGAIVCSAWPGAVKTVHCYALEDSCTKFLNTTVKMSVGDMQSQAFADTLNANVEAGIMFADDVNQTEKAVPAVNWQYTENEYPTIPMVKPVVPQKDLTPEEQMDLIRQRITQYFLRNDAVHSSGAHNGICYVSEAGEYKTYGVIVIFQSTEKIG